MELSRQEYWSGLLFPSLGNLPDPGIEPSALRSSALAGELFTTSATWDEGKGLLVVFLLCWEVTDPESSSFLWVPGSQRLTKSRTKGAAAAAAGSKEIHHLQIILT